MATTAKFLAVFLFLIAAATLVNATASAGSFDVSFSSPDHDSFHKQTITLNVSAKDGANYTEVYHNGTESFDTVVWNLSDDDAAVESNGTHEFFIKDFDTTTVDDGSLGFNATAYNHTQAGSTDVTGWATIVISVDNEAPKITGSTPSDGDNVTGTVTVGADASEPGSSIDLLEHRWVNSTGDNETGWLSNDTDTDTTNFVAGDGEYTIEFNTTDELSNFNDSYNVSVTVDNTLPNATDDLNLTDSDFDALVKWSNVAGLDRFLAKTTFNLNWTGYNVSNELSDATSGVKQFEVWVRNRTYNTSSNKVTDWGAWSRLDSENITATAWDDSNTTDISLESGHQYELNLTVRDWADHVNQSNAVTVTLDTDGPGFGLHPNGSAKRTEWINEVNGTVSATIADMAGIDKSSITGYFAGTKLAGENISFQDGTNRSRYTVSMNDSTLNDLSNFTDYTAIINATDTLGNKNDSIEWTVSTDFSAPNVSNTVVHSGADHTDDDDNDWYKDEVLVEVACTEGSGDGGESGLSGVAALRGDSISAGWNTSLESDAGNLTITRNGAEEYNMTCRDVAGNTNATNLTLRVDAKEPAVTDLDPDDDVSRNPTLTLSFNDESGESGIDTDSSELYLYTEDDGEDLTDQMTIDWAQDGAELEIEDLSYDTEYLINGTLVDNVGHTYDIGQNEADFDTKTNDTSNDEEEDDAEASGGGGGTLVDSMAFGSAPSSMTVVRGNSKSTTVTLENDGDLTLDNVDVTFDIDVLDASATPSGFDMSSGDEEDITVEVEAASGASTGVYEGTLEAESDEGTTASVSWDVEVVANEPVFSVTDRPDAISVTRGNTTTVSLTVENTGNKDATDVSFSIDVSNVSASVTTGPVDIDQGSSTTVDISVDETDVPVGVYQATFSAATDAVESTTTIDIKVQPASEAEEQAIEQRIADLKRQVESSGNESDTELSTLVSEAETAIDEGDYAQAAEIQRQLERQLDGGGGGLPILPIILIILFGLVAGVGIYLYAGTSESGDDYGRYSSDLGPVRASKESYQYHDRSLLDRVTDMLHDFWMYIDRNILHHSRKAGQQAQARINEFRDGASRRARGQQGGMPRGGDFTPRDEED